MALAKIDLKLIDTEQTTCFVSHAIIKLRAVFILCGSPREHPQEFSWRWKRLEKFGITASSFVGKMQTFTLCRTWSTTARRCSRAFVATRLHRARRFFVLKSTSSACSTRQRFTEWMFR